MVASPQTYNWDRDFLYLDASPQTPHPGGLFIIRFSINSWRFLADARDLLIFLTILVKDFFTHIY